jgi:hypothetical protein
LRPRSVGLQFLNLGAWHIPGTLGPRAETLNTLKHWKRWNRGKNRLGPRFLGPRFLDFGASRFLRDLGSLGPRAETGNKKIREKIEESKRGAPKSAGPVAYAASAIWLIRHWFRHIVYVYFEGQINKNARAEYLDSCRLGGRASNLQAKATNCQLGEWEGSGSREPGLRGWPCKQVCVRNWVLVISAHVHNNKSYRKVNLETGARNPLWRLAEALGNTGDFCTKISTFGSSTPLDIYK